MNAGAQVFKRGERVFLASGGVATVVDFAARDAAGKPAPWTPELGAPAFYVVMGEEVTACVPIAAAQPSLRRLVSPEVARELLDILRGPPLPPPDTAAPLVQRGREVVHSGSPVDHARLLRELCSLPAPLPDALASGLAFVSRLLLPELAEVLKLDAAALQAELRERYPAAASLPGGIRFAPGG